MAITHWSTGSAPPAAEVGWAEPGRLYAFLKPLAGAELIPITAPTSHTQHPSCFPPPWCLAEIQCVSKMKLRSSREQGLCTSSAQPGPRLPAPQLSPAGESSPCSSWAARLSPRHAQAQPFGSRGTAAGSGSGAAGLQASGALPPTGGGAAAPRRARGSAGRFAGAGRPLVRAGTQGPGGAPPAGVRRGCRCKRNVPVKEQTLKGRENPAFSARRDRSPAGRLGVPAALCPASWLAPKENSITLLYRVLAGHHPTLDTELSKGLLWKGFLI